MFSVCIHVCREGLQFNIGSKQQISKEVFMDSKSLAGLSSPIKERVKLQIIVFSIVEILKIKTKL